MSELTDDVQYIWFLNSLVKIRVSAREGADGLSVLEHKAPYRDSPPLHIHKNEDEVFYVIEGNFRLVVGDKENIISGGDTFLAPKGIPHTYIIESAGGGHWLTAMRGSDFERLVIAMGRTAEMIELPAPAGPPSEEEKKYLRQIAAGFGIEIVGPPLM